MKISYNWLKQYIDVDHAPKDLAAILTNIGLEVEAIEDYESVRGGLEGVVIGEVKTCEKHPNADKLVVTTVDIGAGKDIPIVCGAPNVKAGQKVPVAVVGTILYRGMDQLEIKKTRIRDEWSEGMICAEDELGLGDNHEGIMVLDHDAIVGTPASEYFKIERDTIFEIGLTPNRIDGASHFGVARDLFAYFQIREPLVLTRPSIDGFKIDNTDLKIDVAIEDPLSCPRYAGITISDVNVTSSPEWLQNRLKSIGLTPINNIVDITNFVLHELGQPLHAFDADKISGKRVIVKTLPENTEFVSLDEEVRKLAKTDLMICNEKDPMCIAGVLGGIHSGVTDNTRNLFLESAYFNPGSVRKSSRKHGLNTDASFRFERGADPGMTIPALKRAALLIKEIAGGKISSDVTDNYPRPIGDHTIDVDFAKISRLTGMEIDKKVILNILTALEIEILEEHPSGLKLKVPAFRVDVTREADIVEEILRIYGYDNVVFSKQQISSLPGSQKPDRDALINVISDLLTNNGFREIMSNSLTRLSYYEGLKQYPENKTVKLVNPLSSDLNAMRQTLFFGGIETIAFNTNRQHPDLLLYEKGNVYQVEDPLREAGDLNNYTEKEHLGIWLSGNRHEGHWNTAERNTDFFQLKAYFELILRRFGLDNTSITLTETSNDLLSDGLVYNYMNREVGIIGVVRNQWISHFDLRNPVMYGDINLDIIIEIAGKSKIEYREVTRFPEVKRDLALLVDRSVRFDQIKKIAFKSERNLLRQVSLFDVYEGKQIAEGKKSYAISLTLQDPKRTLTEKHIEKVVSKMVHNFNRELGAEIR